MTDGFSSGDPTRAADGSPAVGVPPASSGSLPLPTAGDDDFMLPGEIQRALSPMALQALSRMTAQQRASFVHSYNSQKKSVGLMIALAILFPIQLLLLGETGLGIAFLLTCGGAGFWYIAEWFLTPGRVKKYNVNAAEEIIMRMKAMQS